MNPKLRVRLLLAVFIILIGANLYMQLGNNSLEGAMFWTDGVELNSNLSPSLTRKIEDVRQSPRLSFRRQDQAKDQPRLGRNPFIFGTDRRAEAEQRQRLAELQAKREETLAKMAAEPEPVVDPQEAKPGIDAEIVGIFENLENGVRKAAIRTDLGLQTLGEGDVLNRRFRVLQVSYSSVRFYDLTEKREIQVEVTP